MKLKLNTKLLDINIGDMVLLFDHYHGKGFFEQQPWKPSTFGVVLEKLDNNCDLDNGVAILANDGRVWEVDLLEIKEKL